MFLGHRYGTDSPGLEAAVTKVSVSLDRLMQGLHERGILPCVNILLVSDHGMDNHFCNQTVELAPVFAQSPALTEANFTDNSYFLYGVTLLTVFLCLSSAVKGMLHVSV